VKRRLAALALAMLLCLPLTACQKQQKLYSATWFDLFDTVAVVQGYAASQQDWDRQAAAMYDDLTHYNQLFDIYNHYDDVVNLYDVNAQAAAAPVRVGDELYAFLRWCKDTAYPATDGATNIAAGAVLRLWHDARESDSPAPPAADAIAEALQHINIENLILDDAAQTVCFADPDMTLDVGAVGKGYAVEQAAQAAQVRGFTSALLNVGGNLRAIGTKPGGKPWTAGVENPWGDDPAYIQAVELADGDSLVISGDNGRKGYNEPQDMKEALVGRGVPAEAIYLDYAGFRTYDSVVRMEKIFGQESFTVISQEFHNRRAVYIAQALGLDAVGYNAADVAAYAGMKTRLREKLARVRMFMDLWTGKTPKFLGEPVEIGK